MPRLIPAGIFSNCPSPGEQEIFTRLKNAPNIDNWIVLHSLDLADHVRNISGEADFVVIIPGLGLLCIEVKACNSLRRDDHGWWYGNKTTPDPRGPFRQASEAMHSIRQRISMARPGLRNVPCSSAVIFPYVPFKKQSSEWHDWQVVDQQKFRTRSLPDLLQNILINAIQHLRSKGVKWLPDVPGPSSEEAAQLAELLRPSFEVFASPRLRTLAVREELRQYTTEQYRALDAMSGNSRVLFAGPAGTGKTLLAIESARRASASQSNVLVLCFNRNLGRWLAEQLTPLAPRVKVSTMHRYLIETSKSGTPANASSSFWEVELPERASTSLLKANSSCYQFDELIVDEAQDILRQPYLDVLDIILKGGLGSGRWRLFGDFEKQALYMGPNNGGLENLRTRASFFTDYSLRDNCRNPPRIASLVHLLGRLTPDYRTVLRADNGYEASLLYYSNTSAQSRLLAEQLSALGREGASSEDIILLSTRADSGSAAAGLKAAPWPLAPFSTKKRGQLGYCTIHAFKGLEARIVIMTDVEELSPSNSADLFYTGVTRALDRVIILASTSARHSIINALLNNESVKNGGSSI